MDLNQKDHGVIAVLLKRFETERYPKMQALQKKVDDGGVLDERDLEYLEQILHDSHQVMALVKRHPEYGSLAKKVLESYQGIMTKSQENNK
ncbi:hypothetical protein E2K93_00795 [Thalassotalea sp. HSM 43]|uniref:hypothetical protein n=1 Tax=Thalassotalea sp. HSM 43 TaxID=2552945 RepID=UPI0010819844|nr:hypothetical protein [Thalassotalea sp. HSM 43]QBY02995.1 hypothetical protein E2K93_00795 [Thalassotalea sp. HSM 43]